MKRKVIQLAGKTHVVSLPHQWVKTHSVKKGQEVDVHEKEGMLIIQTPHKKQPQKLLINVAPLNNTLHRVLGACYKLGYDHLICTNVSQQHYTIIQKTLQRTCVGWEIVEHKAMTVTIKSITTLHQEELPAMVRRLFLTLLTTMEELPLLPPSEQEEYAYHQDDLVNKYADYARRMLHYHPQKYGLYVFVEHLEQLGDILKHWVKHTNHKQDVTWWMKGIAQLRSLYTQYYGFVAEQADKDYQQVSTTIKKLDKLQHQETLVHTQLFFQTLHDMYSALFMIHFVH